MEYRFTRRRFLQLTAGAAAFQSIQPVARALGNSPTRSLPNAHLVPNASPIQEPYAFLHGGKFTGPDIPESPDPLVGYRWDNPLASDDLQNYVLRPVSAHAETPKSFKNIDAASGSDGVVTVQGTGSIRFDFGVESAAWIEFDSPDLSGSVEMSISEYDEPAIENSGPEHPSKTSAPKQYGKTYRLELNKELYEGVRFGWIHVRSFSKPWHITAVRAVCQVKPTNYNGAFSCSDSMLTRIWYTGAYSVKVNLCKDYFAAILMDRGDRFSWTGDAHPAQAAALTAFGNWDFVKLNLERTAATSNGIESYALYWVLSLLDYYQHTNDTETMQKSVDHAKALLEHGKSVYDSPNIVFYGWDERLGAGFEDATRPETVSAYRMLFVRACQEFALALDQIGQGALGTTYRELASQKMTELRANEHWYQSLGVHALADAVNTGLTTEAEQSAIFAQEFSDRLNRLSYSPFNQYFILQAMGRMKRQDEVLTSVRDLWGGQIDYGGTTFFETYAPSWNKVVEKNAAVPDCQAGYTSLAHAWGSGVTTWLSQEVLGIRPTAPGFSTVDIVPNLGTTLNWVSGTVPTPHGPVTVHFDQRSGKGNVTIPQGCVGRIGVPTTGRPIQKVTVNGRVAWDGKFQETSGVGGATAEKDCLYLNDVQPGSYQFSVQFHGGLPKITSPPMAYPVPSAKQNASLGGDWGRVYGREGYVLFDYDGAGKDHRQLPAYVATITTSSGGFNRSLHSQLSGAALERRALAPSPGNERVRKVGAAYTGSPSACQQSMSVDVTLATDHEYGLALYFVDWDKQGRRQAIELFDLKSLKRLAPVQVVQDFPEGKYLIYSCSGSVRIRINQIRGDNAVLNALFFDPHIGGR